MFRIQRRTVGDALIGGGSGSRLFADDGRIRRRKRSKISRRPTNGAKPTVSVCQISGWNASRSQPNYARARADASAIASRRACATARD